MFSLEYEHIQAITAVFENKRDAEEKHQWKIEEPKAVDQEPVVDINLNEACCDSDDKFVNQR